MSGMRDDREEQPVESERGFGTGLRDQLARKRELEQEARPASTEAEPAEERVVFARMYAAVPAPVPASDPDLAIRSAELAALADKLAEREAELETFERSFEDKRATLASEGQRLEELRDELEAQQSRRAEVEKQVDAKLR